MLMEPRPRPDTRVTELSRRRSRRLRWMVAGSVLVHALLLAFLVLVPPEPEQDQPANSPNEVSMVFESQGATKASTPSPNQAASAAQGAPDATEETPQTTTSAPPPPPPAPVTPPTPAPPTPAEPSPPQPTPPPPEPQPPQTPQPETPQPETPPPPVQPPPPPSPPAPRLPATVSLSEGELPPPPPPRFVMPQPPPPLPPPPPRPSPPRLAARPPSQNPFAPQDWSLNAAPSTRAPSRSSRGIDLDVPSLGGQTDSTMSYVAGARPSGDWIGALKRWVQAHTYYPEAALDQQQQGAVTVVFQVDRSGRVLSSSLARSSRSPFLDMGFLGEFRGATVPSFTPDMTDPTTTVAFTMTYVLVNRRR